MWLAIGCTHARSASTVRPTDGGMAQGDADMAQGDASAPAKEAIPAIGATAFVSADPSPFTEVVQPPVDSGIDRGDSGPSAPEPIFSLSRSGTEVERALPRQRVALLNGYRGFQIVDLSKPAAPRLEGRFPVVGIPVAFYVVGNRALLLRNDGRRYDSARKDLPIDGVPEAFVDSLDLTDTAHPKLLDELKLDGSIVGSALPATGGAATLFLALRKPIAPSTPPPDSSVIAATTHTWIQSFDATAAKPVAKASVDLGAAVSSIRVSGSIMAALGGNPSQSESRTAFVTLVDLSQPDLSARSSTFALEGTAPTLNVDGSVVRIASLPAFNGAGATTSHLETFDAADLTTARRLAHCTFGDDSPYAASAFSTSQAFFLAPRSSVVHSLTIDPQGKCSAAADLPGPSDYEASLQLVRGGTRLLEIESAKVSLLDISSPASASPIAQVGVQLDLPNSPSALAMGVLENATSVKASDGTTETDLALLPSGDKLQVVSFSDHTLSARGSLNQGTRVIRSFAATSSAQALLSEDQLTLFNLQDPDHPVELGRSNIAPNYDQLFVYGAYVARIRDDSGYYAGLQGVPGLPPAIAMPSTHVEIVPHDADIDTAAPIASFTIPGPAHLSQVGNLLVSVQMVRAPLPQGATTASYDKFDGVVRVYDLSDPKAPRVRGSLHAQNLQQPASATFWYGRAQAACRGCSQNYPPNPYSPPVPLPSIGHLVVLAQPTAHEGQVESVQVCEHSAQTTGGTCQGSLKIVCTAGIYQGMVQCVTPHGGQEQCMGELAACSDDGLCTTGSPATRDNCYAATRQHHWSSFSFDFIDVSNPDAPVLRPRVTTPTDREVTSLYFDQAGLYVSYLQPIKSTGASQPLVKHYFSVVDLGDPAHPTPGPGINVPGDVVGKTADGSLYTRDLIWFGALTETMIAKLRVSGGLARLQAAHTFPARVVDDASLDASGKLVISHGAYWEYAKSAYQLSTLDGATLHIAGQTDVDDAAHVLATGSGKVAYLIAFDEGVLLMDVNAPSAPAAQAYFPITGVTPTAQLSDSELILLGGPYGLSRYGSDTHNLRTK